MKTTVRFNPYEPGFHANPYPQYRALREEDPVHKSFMGTWVLTRYSDIEPILEDSENFSSDLRSWDGFEQRYKNKAPVAWMLNRSVLNTDAPVHPCLRKPVVKAFAPRDMNGLVETIATIANKRLDSIDVSAGRFDVMSSFAVPAPVDVISHIYGVKDEDRAQVKQWSVDVSGLIEPLPSLTSLKSAEQSIHHFGEYLRHRVEEGGTDNFPGCMAGALGSGEMDMDHILANLILMFPAGHETTVNLIGNGIYCLLRSPEQRERLAANPDLIDSAIEEMLRYESPQQVAWRALVEDAEIGGKHIAKGEQIMMVLGAANRDPEFFEAPDDFNIARRPNPHLAFGLGRHSCLGSWFAKLQAKKALQLFLERFPKLSLAAEPPVWHSTLSFHGLKSLPVTIG